MFTNWTLTIPSRADGPSFGARLLTAVRTWYIRSKQRRALAELDDRMLRDLGLTRHDVLKEAAKPFWAD
ncbi:MAG: DUF1127 domain-containing protein [Pseudomonadota bacterium]